MKKKTIITNDAPLARVRASGILTALLAACVGALLVGATRSRAICAQSASEKTDVSKPVLERWGISVPPPAGVPDGVSIPPADYWMDRGHKLKETALKESGRDPAPKIEKTNEAVKCFYFALHHDPTSTKIALTIARTQFELGRLYVTASDPQNAFKNLRESLSLYKKISEVSANQSELMAVKDETAAIYEYLKKFVAAANQASAAKGKQKPPRENLSERGKGAEAANASTRSAKENTPEPPKGPRQIRNERTRIWASELLEAVRDSDRKRAAKELGKTGDPDAVEPLAKALRTDRDQDVRREAAKSLGRLAYPEAIPALGEALLDQFHNDDEVRKEIAESLGRIGDPAAVAVLVKALRKDISKNVRAEAADSLGLIGSRKAVRYLRDALSDSSGRVRDHASKALEKIRGYR